MKLLRAVAAAQKANVTWRHIALHPAQAQIYNGTARFKVIACGRRFGKTQESIQVLGEAALTTGHPYAYLAPTYKALKDVWRAFKAALAEYTIVKNEQELRLELVNGGVLDFWSLDSVDTIRGRKYAGMVIDEAAYNKDLEYAWNFVLRPTLTDLRGWAWFISTPKGRDYFWQLWLRGQDPATPEWASWRFPTTANPYIDPAEIEEQREFLPERTFKQEYEADFIEDAGAVFRNVTACATASPQDGPRDGEWYVFGVDWGRSEDFTVIVVLAHDGRMVAMDRFNHIGWAVQRGRLTALAEVWKPRAIWAETNPSLGGEEGDPNIEALQDEGLPVVPFLTTPSSKGPLINSLALDFEKQEVAIWNPEECSGRDQMNARVLINELQAYTMVRLISGHIRYTAPASLHDDCVMAIALARYGVRQGVYMPGQIQYAPPYQIGGSSY